MARGELLALVTATKIAIKYEPPRTAVLVTDAKYVCNVVRFICSGLWMHILHRLPNCDLISELAGIWDKQRFRVRKVKSHRTFDSAAGFDDLWMIAGNVCADLAATATFRSIPHNIRTLAGEIACHTVNEEKRLQCVLAYIAAFNKKALQSHQ